MKKYILACSLLSIVSFACFAQKETVNDFSNKLLCYAYVYGKTDTATVRFLQSNFPYLTRPKPENGFLTPPESVDAKHTITTLTLKKHPFFNFKMKEGHLEFFTVDDGGGIIFEKGAQLQLIFDNSGDADYVFGQLSDSLQRLCYQKTVTPNGVVKTLYFTAYANGSVYKPELALTIDDNNKIYKILFKNDASANK